jgi:hypothetical protein
MRGELVGALARRRRPDRPASSAASRVRDAARDDGAVCSVFLQRLIVVACRRARGRGARAKLRQIERLEQFITRAERVVEQIQQRMRGERITNRLVSIFGPGRATDPQGQARQAERVRVRDADLRGDREHPARRARTDRADQQPGRQPAGETRCCQRPSRNSASCEPSGEGSQLALSARDGSALPLGLLRTRGLSLELGPDDLRMDEQAARVLLSATGLEISDDGVGELVRRPEGWSGHVPSVGVGAGRTDRM